MRRRCAPTFACGRNAAQVQGSSMLSRIDADLFFELRPLAVSPLPSPPLASPSPLLLLLLLRARLGLSTDISTPVTGLKTRARPSPQHASRYLYPTATTTTTTTTTNTGSGYDTFPGVVVDGGAVSYKIEHLVCVHTYISKTALVQYVNTVRKQTIPIVADTVCIRVDAN